MNSANTQDDEDTARIVSDQRTMAEDVQVQATQKVTCNAKISSLKDQSFVVNLTISATCVGLEALHHEMSELRTPAERSKRVRTLVHSFCAGKPYVALPSAQLFSSNRDSYKVTFRIAGRDIGFEPVYARLIELPDAYARNHFIRRFLFEHTHGLQINSEAVAAVSLHHAVSDQTAAVTQIDAAGVTPLPAEISGSGNEAHKSKRRKQAMQIMNL